MCVCVCVCVCSVRAHELRTRARVRTRVYVCICIWVGPVSQDISEPDEWEPFRFILALVAGFLGAIPINPDSSGRIFGNHQDILEPTRRSLAHMNFWLYDFFLNRFWWVSRTVAALMRLCNKSLLTYLFISLFMMHSLTEGPNGFTSILFASFRVKIHWVTIHCTPACEFSHACGEQMFSKASFTLGDAIAHQRTSNLLDGDQDSVKWREKC